MFDKILWIVRQGDVRLSKNLASTIVVELVDDEVAIWMRFDVIDLGLDGVGIDPVVVIDELDVVAMGECQASVARKAWLSVGEGFRD